jgi:hypothetical protein
MTECKSWGESINAILAEKRLLQFEQPKVIQRTRLHGRSWLDPDNAKPDPILQVPFSANAQKAMLENERDQLVRSINNGFQKELDRTEVPYNVLNFQPKFGLTLKQVTDSSLTSRASGLKHISPNPSVEYNILTLKADHENSLQIAERRGRRIPTDAGTLKTREFNVISGDYFIDNVNRRREKEEMNRTRLMENFQSTHDYHPVLGTFYDADKEATATERESTCLKLKKEMHHSDISAPQCIRRSEGHAYDILTGTEFHPPKAKSFDDTQMRGVPPRVSLRNTIALNCDATEDTADRDCRRALNRKSRIESDRDRVRHGHDIITNQPYGLTTTEAKSVAPSPDHMATTTVHKNVKAPPVSVQCLRAETVGSRLAKVKQISEENAKDNAAATLHQLQHVTESSLPSSSFQKILLLPQSTRSQFVKPSRAIVSNVGDYLSSTASTSNKNSNSNTSATLK